MAEWATELSSLLSAPCLPEVGAGSTSGGGISDTSGWSWYLSLAIAPDGTPHVAWEDDSDEDAEIYVRWWVE